MRIVFMGVVEEGWLTLRALLSRPGHRQDISHIVTLTETAGGKLSGYRAFEDLAREFEVPLLRIAHVRSPESIEAIRKIQPDLLIVIGWPQLLSDEMLAIPPLGAVGLHTTLLPRHRGRAPIPWAIIKGLGKSGNTLFYLTPGVDDGDIIGQRGFYITLNDTAGTIYQKATQAGIDLLLEQLPAIKDGTARRIRQDPSQVDVWPRRRPRDGRIDWTRSALEVHNLIRGVSRPYPGAFTTHRGERLFIWSSALLGPHELDLEIGPGRVLDVARYSGGLVVGAGEEALLIQEVQKPGVEPMTALELFDRQGVAIGEVLGEPEGERSGAGQ